MSAYLKHFAIVPAVMLTLLLGLAAPVMAAAPTLPTTGAELDAWIPVIITGMGTVVLAVTGGYFAFLIVKKGYVWARRALG